MAFYVNDTKKRATLLACNSKKEASVYATWANECIGNDSIKVEPFNYQYQVTGEQLLHYFNFSIDSLVERIFTLLPTRSRVESNMLLIKAMLKEPSLSKSACCQQAEKYPTHYSRLSTTVSNHCAWVSRLSGGRNPMKLLRTIRGDL